MPVNDAARSKAISEAAKELHEYIKRLVAPLDFRGHEGDFVNIIRKHL